MKIDIGCGPYKRHGYLGVDLLRERNVDIQANANSLPFSDSSLDAIYTRNTLEHIPDIFQTLKEFYRVTKHGASVEIMVPHFSSYEYWRDLTHIRPFSVYTFDHFDSAKKERGALPDYVPEVDFEVVKTVLHWWDPNQVAVKRGLKKIILSLLNQWINWWANKYPFLCERIWCWHVGGFVLVTFHLRTHKPKRQFERKLSEMKHE